MDQKADTFSRALLLALLGGATFGIVAVALTTPKSGKELKESLKALANRLKARGGELNRYEDEEPVAMFI